MQGTLWDLVASLVPADAEPPAIGRISQHETLAKTLLLLTMVRAAPHASFVLSPAMSNLHSHLGAAIRRVTFCHHIGSMSWPASRLSRCRTTSSTDTCKEHIRAEMKR